MAEKIVSGVGRCKCAFWFAVAHDILGVLIMMVGVFGGLVIQDLFIYAGAIIIFLSLIWWVFWFSGNIDVPPEELEDDVDPKKPRTRGLGQALRRVSSSIRDSFRKKSGSVRAVPADGSTEVSLSISHDSSAASSSSKERTRGAVNETHRF